MIWFVEPATTTDAAVMARAHIADFKGGVLLPGSLVASTLAELRQMMPAGLTREEPAGLGSSRSYQGVMELNCFDRRGLGTFTAG